jgi:hypothetical protein
MQEIEMQDGSRLEVQRIDTRASEEHQGQKVELAGVYVFWFVADGQRTASHWKRQSAIIRDLLTKNTLPRWAYISFLTTCRPGEEDETFRKVSDLIARCEPILTRRSTSTSPGPQASLAPASR